MARKKTTSPKAQKKVTRYTYDNIWEPHTPDTGYAPLLLGGCADVASPSMNRFVIRRPIAVVTASSEQPA